MGIQQAFLNLPDQGAAQWLAELVRDERFDDMIGALQSIKALKVTERLAGHQRAVDMSSIRSLRSEHRVLLRNRGSLLGMEIKQLLQVALCETYDLTKAIEAAGDEAIQSLGKSDFWRLFEMRYPLFEGYVKSRNERAKHMKQAGFSELPDGRGGGPSDASLERWASS